MGICSKSFSILCHFFNMPSWNWSYDTLHSFFQSMLFWTVWGDSARIERSYLDGSVCVILVQKDILWPSDLATDVLNSRLYWADVRKASIQAIDLHEKNNRPSQCGSSNMVSLGHNSLYICVLCYTLCIHQLMAFIWRYVCNLLCRF